LGMLAISMLLTCSLTMAHIFTGQQSIDPTNTVGGWGGTVYGTYDSYTKNLELIPSILPGPTGGLPSTNIAYYYMVLHNGTVLSTGSHLGYSDVYNGSVSPFSTDLSNLVDLSSVGDDNITISVAFGGTGYTSRYNYFGRNNYLNITANADNSTNVTNITDVSLDIKKTVNTTDVHVGDLVRYTINVKNLGLNPVTSVKVNDTLPDSLEFISSDSNNSGSSGMPYLWNIPSLNSGDTATLNIVCKIKKTGIIKNTASLIINNYENNLTNDSSVDINATIPPKQTSINLTANSINFRDTVHIIATLFDNDSLPLNNQSIDFNIANWKYTAKTDENGTAKWNIPKLITALYSVTASFNGTDEYSSSTKTIMFGVFGPINDTNDTNNTNSTNNTKLNTNIISQDIGVYEGDNVTFNATLVDDNSNKLVNKSLIVSVGNEDRVKPYSFNY